MKKENKTQIILLRHGESKANKAIEKDKASWFNNPDNLTNEGIRKAEEIATDLEKYNINLIISSNTLRTKETAKIIANKLNIPKVLVSDNLIEHKLSSHKLSKEQLDLLQEKWSQGKDFAFVGGEKINEFKDRIYKELSRYFDKNLNILVIMHEAAISILSAFFSCQNIMKARLNKIDYCEGRLLKFKERELWEMHKIPQDQTFYSNLPFRKTVVVLALKNEKLLVVHKKGHPQDIWTLPAGGKKNYYEKSEEVIQRELFEELKLKDYSLIKRFDYIRRFDWPPSYKGHKGFRGAEMEFFIIKIKQHNIDVDNSELDDAKFISIDKIEEYLDLDFKYGYGSKLREYIKNGLYN